MKNTIRFGALAAVSALALAACSSAPEETSASAAPTTSAAAPIDYKACMVSDAGGFDDKSFNQAGYEGLQSVANDTGVQVATAESTDEADYATNITAMVSANCDLIITVGFLLADATAAAATATPDTDFAIIDFAFDPADSQRQGPHLRDRPGRVPRWLRRRCLDQDGHRRNVRWHEHPHRHDLHGRLPRRRELLQHRHRRLRQGARLGRQERFVHRRLRRPDQGPEPRSGLHRPGRGHHHARRRSRWPRRRRCSQGRWRRVDRRR